METLEFIIFGGETKRFHTWPTVENQRVDSHSFHVAMLVSMMAQDAKLEEGEGLTVPLLMAALTHDLAEHRVGDLPAPAKRSLPDYPEGKFREVWGNMENKLLQDVGLDWEFVLLPRQKRWLKLADAMEGNLYCIRERMKGNRYIDVCYNNFRNYVDELLQDEEEPMVLEIVAYIDDAWEQAQ